MATLLPTTCTTLPNMLGVSLRKHACNGERATSSIEPKRVRLTCQPQRSPLGRRVRFVESRNVYYPAPEPLDDRDLAIRWYNKQEIAAHDAQATQQAVALKTAERAPDALPNSWARTLFRVFRALQQGKTLDEIEFGLAQRLYASNQQQQHQQSVLPFFLDEHIVGLESAVVAPVSRDFTIRRQHILQHFQWYQGSNIQQHPTNNLQPQIVATSDQRALEMAHAIRLESRVSRQYALCLGKLAAAQPS